MALFDCCFVEFGEFVEFVAAWMSMIWRCRCWAHNSQQHSRSRLREYCVCLSNMSAIISATVAPFWIGWRCRMRRPHADKQENNFTLQCIREKAAVSSNFSLCRMAESAATACQQRVNNKYAMWGMSGLTCLMVKSYRAREYILSQCVQYVRVSIFFITRVCSLWYVANNIVDATACLACTNDFDMCITDVACMWDVIAKQATTSLRLLSGL